MNDEQKGWLSGIIDGEGSFNIIKQKNNSISGFQWYVVLNIGNTDYKICKKVQSLIDGNINIDNNNKKKNINCKTMFFYRSKRKSLYEILPSLNLISKNKQKEVILEACKLMDKFSIKNRHIRKRPIEYDNKMQILKNMVGELNA